MYLGALIVCLCVCFLCAHHHSVGVNSPKKKAPPPKNISSLFKIQIKSASAAVWCARSAGLELLIAELFEEKVKNLVHRVQFQQADGTQVLIYHS